MTVKLPGIPDPGVSPESLREAVVQLKQAVEILGGVRNAGNMKDAAVTWQDLVNLLIIPPQQIPNKP